MAVIGNNIYPISNEMNVYLNGVKAEVARIKIMMSFIHVPV